MHIERKNDIAMSKNVSVALSFNCAIRNVANLCKFVVKLGKCYSLLKMNVGM